MANLDSSKILKAIAKAEGSFGDAEMREGSNATAKLLFLNEGSAFKNLKTMKKALVQPTEAILQKKTPITLINNKLSAHAGAIGDSFASPVTFIQKSAPFKISYKLAENNRFSYQEQLNQRMEDAMQSIRASINAYGLAQLAALKTQVTAGTGLMAWDGINFIYENAALKLEKAMSNIKSIARKNKYGGALDVIGGQQLVADMIHNAAQGSANGTNYGYQMLGLSLAEEEILDEATLGANGFGYVLPKGLVGMTSWNEPINRSPQGSNNVDDNTGLFTTIADAVIPRLSYDVHVKRGLADTVAGAITYYQDPVDEYEITAIYSFSHAMISTANETPIFAVKQL